VASSAASAATLIEHMTRRVVRRFRPERVILFGSHARGEAGPDSDIDLLVVLPIEGSKREKRIQIRLALHGLHAAADVIVSTPEEFAWRKDIVGTVEYPAAHEGKVLYERR
jgi:predicted nucleotidyltransferase